MPGQGSGARLSEQGLTGVLQGAGWVAGFRLVFVFFEAEVKFKFNGNGNGNGNGSSPVCGCRRAGAGEAGSRDTPQVRPCRLRHRIHAVEGPATLPPPPPDSAAVLMGEQEQGQEPGREPEPGRLGGRLGGGGQCRATLGTYEQTPIPTIPNYRITELPNYPIFECDAEAPVRGFTENVPESKKSRCHPRLPVVCRGAVRLGWRDPPPHGCGGGAYTDVLAACPANPTVPSQQ